MWVIQIEGNGKTYLCYRPVLANPEAGTATVRVAELYDGPPSLGDIDKIQNFLDSYKAVPIGKSV